MSSNSNHGAPSYGTKVDLGENAPVNQENAGIVAQDSLAAESYRKDGDFASNPGARPEKFSIEERAEALGGASSGSAQGQTAPSYVESQYIRDNAGPHGKNIHEAKLDDSELHDGLKRALRSEPGSQDDPSRLAEQRFQFQDSAAPGGQGPRENAVGSNTAFGKLDGEKEA
ncbi:hypothetical protein K4F52_007496 [Lecanicillium sp. MT-2017a]|nr:hypothetical protein K4F52_007496 [Lecanicillium sp. MT-2017a]